MKTMHRTSTAGLAIGSAVVAACAIALTALTRTGTAGAYAFLFAGLFIFCVFLIWPERTRPFRSDRGHGSVRRQSR